METETLRACPFCGGEAHPDKMLRDGCRPGEPDAWAYFIACNSCAAEGGWAKTPGNAVRNWNRRTPAEPHADTPGPVPEERSDGE